MVRCHLGSVVLLSAGLMLSGTAAAAEEVKKAPIPARGFYQKYLAPTMTSRLSGESEAAIEYTNRATNPWMRDTQTVNRIEQSAMSAATSALKRYALHSLQIDTWSISILGGHETESPTVGGDAGRTRVRFGISQLAPRADVLIPSDFGRVIFSADARGRLATSFESTASNFSLFVSYDAPARSGLFTLVRRF